MLGLVFWWLRQVVRWSYGPYHLVSGGLRTHFSSLPCMYWPAFVYLLNIIRGSTSAGSNTLGFLSGDPWEWPELWAAVYFTPSDHLDGIWWPTENRWSHTVWFWWDLCTLPLYWDIASQTRIQTSNVTYHFTLSNMFPISLKKIYNW